MNTFIISLLIFLSVAIFCFATLQLLQFRVKSLSALLSSKGATDQAGIPEVRLLRDQRYSQREWANRLLQDWSVAKKLHLAIAQSGVSIMVDTLILAMSGLALLVMALILSVGFGLLPALLLGFLAFLLPLGILDIQKRRQLALIEVQLPNALDSLSRAMQAGNSFTGALSIVGRDTPDPLGAALRLVSDEINFGSSTREGLQALTERIDSLDIRYFVMAVLIHSQTGGNLTDLLKTLAGLIRDRQRLRKLGRALTAEGRLSAWILTLMPFVTAALIYAVNPTFMSILWTDPVGLKLVEAMILMMIIGAAWMWKIVHFKI